MAAAAAATLAWRRWRHYDRFGVAARWRDLPAPARYYRTIRGSIATGGCFLRRRGKRVGTEGCQRGWGVTSSSSTSSSKRGKVYSGSAIVLPGFILKSSVICLRFSVWQCPKYKVRVEDKERCLETARRSAAARPER